MSKFRAEVIPLPARRKLWPIVAAVAILVAAIALGVPLVAGANGTCPDGNGWTKVDSGDLSLYPVDGATAYCFKAGTETYSTIEEWLESGKDLSHWSYFIPEEEETPTPTPPTPTPTDTPPTPTPTDTPPTPTPTDTSPTPTPTDTPPCEECEPTPTPTSTPPDECKLIPQYEQWRLTDSETKSGYLPCYIISIDPPSVERQATLCTACGDQLSGEYTFRADSWRHGTVYLNECTGEYVFIFDSGTKDEEWLSVYYRPYLQDNIRTKPRCPNCEIQATAQVLADG